MNAHQMVIALMEAGITQMKIAAETGLSQPSVSRLATERDADTNLSCGLKLVTMYNRICGKRRQSA